MRSTKHLQLFLLVVLFSNIAPSIADTSGTYLHVDKFGWDFEIGSTPNDLKRLGKPLNEKVTSEPNLFIEGKFDEIRELEFAGLYIKVIFPEKNHKRMIVEHVVITNNNWKMTNGIRIGSTQEDVTKLLGPPPKQDGDRYEYWGDNSPVYFHFKDGKLVKVHWHLYTG